MLQPVNLQLAHFNIEHSAQISRDAIAAAQQTGQGQEVAQESVRRTQMVQAGLAAAEVRKVKRKEEEERERRREEERQSFSEEPDSSEASLGAVIEQENHPKTSPKSFDFYA
ncbi:MAG: hypothetical protein LBJ36_11255 [Synergistaceae bacterium]|jgi:hypothetical protein|nr:hypothetical protein [Synergistaceae bacterium]